MQVQVTRSVYVFALVAGLFLCSESAAQTSDADMLRQAIELFDGGDYLAAQEILVGLDVDALSADEKSTRDDYLNRAQVAIMMYEKALRDVEDAETAVSDGAYDRARALIDGVLQNEFAADPVRRAALDLQAQLPDESGAAPPAAAKPNGETTRRRASVLVTEADSLAQQGEYDAAGRLYREALSLIPGMPEAVDGLNRVEQFRRNEGGDLGGDSLLERIRRENQINWQRVVAEFRDLESRVRDLVEQESFDEARPLLVRARQVVESGRQFADPISKYEGLRDEYDGLVAFVDNRERDFNQRKVAEIREEIERERAARIEADEENRRRQVALLMEEAMQHRKDGDLNAAINTLKQVTVIDPKNRQARWLLDELDDVRMYRRGREIRETFYEEQRKALLDVEEAKIPWHQLLRYPKDWNEVISRPERQLPGQSGPDRRLLGALDRKVPVQFRGVPFDGAIEHFVDSQQLNIYVNWADLARAGVGRDEKIELDLPSEITLKKALSEILEQAGGGDVDLGYDVSDGMIKIATKHTLDQQTHTRVYDINDLLMEVPIFNDAPMRDLNQANERAAASAAAQRAQMPWKYGDDDDDEVEIDPRRDARVRKIIELIQQTVAPDSWVGSGGTIGRIEEINGQLVITQNSAAQREIGNLLGKLREQRAIQIAVESRFVSVSSHYLEEMGIDLDIVLNAGNAGYDYIPNQQGGVTTDPVLGTPLLLPRTFSRLGFTPNAPNLGTALPNSVGANNIQQPFGAPFLVPQQGSGSGRSGTPVPITNNVLSFTDPSDLGSDVPGSFAGQTIGPALSIFGSFLDNIQVDFLIRATQADSRTTVLTAPQLVLFNGQRSWVAVTIQQNFISQLNPVVGTGAVAQAPQTGTIDSGAVLDVTATVTADKRYVNLTLRPGLTRLLDLQTIPFSGGASGGGLGGGGAAGAAFIQLPTLSSQRVQTTVSIPDGGTLLIGGQKLASETEVEAGVPILSKIPILKRAYSSRTMVKDEQTLLILIKPKIMIQSEQEQLAFPSFQ